MSRGDAPRLAEWVTYHQALGFDEFHVVLDDPIDNSAEILRSLPGSITIDERPAHGAYWDGVPSSQLWPWIKGWKDDHAGELAHWRIPQGDPLVLRQLQHLPGVLNKYAADGDCWVAVIDADEFLVIPGGTIQDLTASADSPRLRFLNFNFDMSSWQPGQSVLQAGTRRWSIEDLKSYGRGWDRRVKSIARHDALLPLVSVHEISRGPHTMLDHETARLHHYKGRDQDIAELPYRVTDTEAIR